MSDYETDNRKQTANGRYSIGTLLGRLGDHARDLLRKEYALATAELEQKRRLYLRHITMAVVSGMFIFTGCLFLLLGLIGGAAKLLMMSGLSEVTATWVSRTAAGLLILVVGLIWTRREYRILEETSPWPKQTADSMKENKEWIREKLS